MNCEYCCDSMAWRKNWHKLWPRNNAHVGKCWHEVWNAQVKPKMPKLWKNCRFIVMIMHVMILLEPVCCRVIACHLWFRKCDATCNCAFFFKAGEYCRRDALNFSHHRTTLKGVFDVVSLCSCESLYIARISSLFIGSSTNWVLVAAFRFPQTTLLCLSLRRYVTLLIHVMSWSEMRRWSIFLEQHVTLRGINRERVYLIGIQLFLFYRANHEP